MLNKENHTLEFFPQNKQSFNTSTNHLGGVLNISNLIKVSRYKQDPRFCLTQTRLINMKTGSNLSSACNIVNQMLSSATKRFSTGP